MKKCCLKGRFCPTAAFTLVELLVVVLIIGILAAVAVPQYQKAVEKSRATQALSLLKTAYDAAATHYMANGVYPNSFDELDIDMPWPKTTSAALKWANMGYEKETRSDGTWSLQLYHANSGSLIIFMGRVTGKYAGAGFQVGVTDPDRILMEKNIRCVERASGGIVFGGDPGDYCEKIMNGTFSPSTANTYRGYGLP